MRSLEEIKADNKKADDDAKIADQIITLNRKTQVISVRPHIGIWIKTDEGETFITEETLKNLVELEIKLKNDGFTANKRIRKIFYEEKLWGLYSL